MRIRIKPLFRAALETVQRTARASTDLLEYAGTREVAILDSVPVGARRAADAQENLHLRLRKIRVKSLLAV
jgi:hypothetical protein